MENKTKNNKKKKQYISYDDARSLLMNKFLELHPRETHPEWLLRFLPPNTDFDDKTGKLFLSLGAYKKDDLGKDYYWEEKGAEKDLIWLNPETGEKMVAITYTPKKYITFFKAALDPETQEVTVLVNTDLSNIVSEELDGF